MSHPSDILVQNLPFTLEGYNFVQVLGSGGFSTVFKVIHLSSGQYFAAKSCAIDRREKQKRNVAIAEMNSLKELYHPNIIKIYDIIEGHDHIFMILEYMCGGSAKSIIPRDVGMRYSFLVSTIQQVLSAVLFCHQQNITHRDIKPDNILFDASGRCVLSDFGLSCNMAEQTLSTDFSGSLPYKAPEILKHHEYDPFKADMWALGVTFYFMATGDLPWDRSGDVKKMIVNGFYIVPKRVPAAIQYIIRSTLIVDPNKRATAEQLLDLPLFKSQTDKVPIAEANARTSLALKSMRDITSVQPRRITKKSLSMSSIQALILKPSDAGTGNMPSLLFKQSADQKDNSALPPLVRKQNSPLTSSANSSHVTFSQTPSDDTYSK